MKQSDSSHSLNELQMTQNMAVSQGDGRVAHKGSDTWDGAHLVSGVNLLPRPHVLFVGATCCRVNPCLQEEPFPPPQSNVQSYWTPPQQAQLDPLLALMVVSPLVLFSSLTALAGFTKLSCQAEATSYIVSDLTQSPSMEQWNYTWNHVKFFQELFSLLSLHSHRKQANL